MSEAPHVAFLHGMLGSPAMWAPVIAALPPGAKTSAAVLPFHGLVPWGSWIESFDEAVTLISERLPSGPLVVVGYSLGGRLALGLAAARPGIRAVIAIGSQLGITTEDERAERRVWDQSMARIAREHGMTQLVDKWEALPIFASQSQLSSQAFALQRATRLAHRPESIARAFDVMGAGVMPFLQPRLAGTEVELLLVAGGEDERYKALNERAASALGCQCVVVADAGHNVALESPANLARLIAPYLDLAPREPPDVSSTGEQAS
jgi:2-succinyl-6-hydroxy-2,4-cyclohexadiene-1-carboxylate synthase